MSESVIYQIKNIENGKRYIGSTVNRKHRWRNHKAALRNNRHYNIHLQRAWNKYGEETFKFSVVEEAEDNLLDREQHYLDEKSPEYNIRPKADRSEHSEETKRRMSRAKKGMYEGEDNPMYGRVGGTILCTVRLVRIILLTVGTTRRRKKKR